MTRAAPACVWRRRQAGILLASNWRAGALGSNTVSHTGVTVGRQAPWAPPLVEMTGGIVGHLLAWERHECDGSWWAWVSWVQESGGHHHHKVVQVRAGSLHPQEPPEAYTDVPRRL